MYNTTFKNIAECQKLNNLTEAELVYHVKQYMNNQNYRTKYNAKKNIANQLLKNDPEVQAKYNAIVAKLNTK
jgi:hypothetical protein